MDQLIPYQAILFPTDGTLADTCSCAPSHPSSRPSAIRGSTDDEVRLDSLLSFHTPTTTSSPTQYGATPGPRMPHPEAHMDFIAEANGLGGAKPWKYFIVDSLDQMNKKFTHPYISVRDIQGPDYNEKYAWRGNIIIGKFRDHDHPFTSFMDASMADFVSRALDTEAPFNSDPLQPILKNFIRTRARQQC
ncbi:hypothetical protein DFH06DRAFT_1322201 [Mycena polygramma]|nr:hypothetical protein DFH06DRAFT_1322201 [Mycena polygramma]